MSLHGENCFRKVSSPDAKFRGKSMKRSREVSVDLPVSH